MGRLAFSPEERVLASLGPCGLAMAIDDRVEREAIREEREIPAPSFVRPPHLERLELAIRDGIAGRLDSTTNPGRKPIGLIVAMPPRHGKSETTSKYTPAWFLGQYPKKKVMLASHEAGLASGFGRKARDLIEDHGEGLYGVRVRGDSHAANSWETEDGGGMATAGVGGALTGKGADLLIIDDPIKNAEEAASETIRDKQWEWWISTARTRLHPGAFVIVVQTRWHEGDLAGRLIRQALADPEGDQWHVLNLPALAEADDPLGRAEGEALWPARYDADYLEQTRKASGPYWFAAMYQQKPTPDDGGVFKRANFRYFEVADTREVALWFTEAQLKKLGITAAEADALPPLQLPTSVVLCPPDGSRTVVGLGHARIFQTADLAASEKQTADFTVVTTFALTPDGQLLILDVRRLRIPGPEQPDHLEKAIQEWEPEVQRVERIGYQTTLVQALVLRSLPVLPIDADKDKVTRAAVAAVRYDLGQVWHPRAAPWLEALEGELLSFPVGEHDDQVDTIAYGARAAMDLPGRRRPAANTQPGVMAGMGSTNF